MAKTTLARRTRHVAPRHAAAPLSAFIHATLDKLPEVAIADLAIATDLLLRAQVHAARPPLPNFARAQTAVGVAPGTELDELGMGTFLVDRWLVATNLGGIKVVWVPVLEKHTGPMLDRDQLAPLVSIPIAQLNLDRAVDQGNALHVTEAETEAATNVMG